MLSNHQIEDIELEILENIDMALGSRRDLVSKLENSNDSITQWIHSISDTNKFFDVGAERIIYDKLYKHNDLGQSSSWPIGSDLSFQHTSSIHSQKVLINIDCKTVSTYNFADVDGKIFIGNNQNSYKTTYKNSGQDRNYQPKLSPIYKHKKEEMFTLSYFICILYEPIPEPLNPSEVKTRLIFTCCMPNGLLEADYKKNLKKDILSGGKSAGISPGQKLVLPNSEIYLTVKDDKFKAIKKSKEKNCIYTKTSFTKKEILDLNTVLHDSKDSSTRFEFLRCSDFIHLKNKKRIKVKYLEDDIVFLKKSIPKKSKGKFINSKTKFEDKLDKFRVFL